MSAPIRNQARTETLTYIGPARRKAHGADGERYRHEWPTGWQVVVLPSKEAAAHYFAPAAKEAGKEVVP